jgi:hypothetical protein
MTLEKNNIMARKILLYIIKSISVWSLSGAALGCFIILFGKIIGQEYRDIELILIISITFCAVGLFQTGCVILGLVNDYIKQKKSADRSK